MAFRRALLVGALYSSVCLSVVCTPISPFCHDVDRGILFLYIWDTIERGKPHGFLPAHSFPR